MINGLINVYKEKGYSSFDVCAVMRGISGQRKVGHTGTLDPNAEGVLPICLGNATKLCDMLKDKRKEYVATFMLGKRTDTLDIWGTVLEERTPKVSEDELRKAIMAFEGGYDQLPPMYSAKKIDGQRLYDLARKGREVEREAVFVKIHKIEILDIKYPEVTIKVDCGKGTYIRSLCEDIAYKCGEIAVMTSLTRTRVSDFVIEEAYTIDKLTEIKNRGELLSVVKPTDFAFMDYEKITVLKSYRKYIDNGNKLSFDMIDKKKDFEDGEIVRIYNDDEEFVGLYLYSRAIGALKPYKMFTVAQ